MSIYDKAQAEMDEWLAVVPSVWRKDGEFQSEIKGDDADGLFIHAGVITGLIESVMTVQDTLISAGVIQPDSPSVLGQASVTNLMTLAVNTFIKRHSDEFAEHEINSLDLEDEVAKLKDMLNLDTEGDD